MIFYFCALLWLLFLLWHILRKRSKVYRAILFVQVAEHPYIYNGLLENGSSSGELATLQEAKTAAERLIKHPSYSQYLAAGYKVVVLNMETFQVVAYSVKPLQPVLDWVHINDGLAAKS